MLENQKIVILHNIVSPYKTLLFNEIFKVYKNIKVLYIAESENNREWDIKKNDFLFPYEILFKGNLDEISVLKNIKKTFNKLNALNPDVLIIAGYSYASYWAGFFWARINRKKIVLWSATNAEDRSRGILKEKLKTFFIKRCDAANVYGGKSKDYLAKLGMKNNKVFIMGNTTNNDFYYNEVMTLKTSREAICKRYNMPFHNFLYIGRFSAEKNIIQLLEAYRRLHAKNIDWGLILVGNGPQKKEYEKYIKKHDIRNVFMPGFKQKEDIPQYLALSDVFILPSISEPWGLVVNEAMAASLPVLVSERCGCSPDLIREGINGFIFDPFDNNKLFRLMKEMTEGKYDLNAMGKASLDIIKDFVPEKAAKTIINAIEFALKNNQ